MKIVRESDTKKNTYEIVSDSKEMFGLAWEIARKFGKREHKRCYERARDDLDLWKIIDTKTCFDGTKLYSNVDKVEEGDKIRNEYLYTFNSDMYVIPYLAWFLYSLCTDEVKKESNYGVLQVLKNISEVAPKWEGIDITQIDKSSEDTEFKRLCKLLAFWDSDDFKDDSERLAVYYERALQAIDFELVEETVKHQRRMTNKSF